MSTTSANTSRSPFLPTQRFFPQDEGLQRELNNSYTSIASAVNDRDIAVYSQSVISTGQKFDFLADDRTQEARRKVIRFGAIAAGATVSLAHGLSGFSTFTRIYGVARTSTNWEPLPYASNVANTLVELFVDFNNVTIINGAAAKAILDVIVVVEFI